MAKLNSEFTVKLDSSFDNIIKLQSLITKREGYIAENQRCLIQNIPPSYGQMFFDVMVDDMNNLLNDIEQSRQASDTPQCEDCDNDNTHHRSSYK